MNDVTRDAVGTCPECDRPKPAEATGRPTEPGTTYCDECLVPFTLDEVAELFAEANLLDSNAARRFRRELFDDLVARICGATTTRDDRGVR